MKTLYIKSIKSILTSLLFFAMIGQSVNCQEIGFELSVGGKSNSGTAPGANGLTVDTYRGVANYTVPLYVYEGREMNFPISVNYATSGVRVDQVAGCVGLGWNLFAGGSINRIVNKNPDGFTILPGGIAPTTSSECQEFNLFECFEDPHKDFYKINTVGLEETLQCIKWQNTAVPMENERIIVDWNVIDYDPEIKITSEDGTVYIFGVDGQESTISSSSGSGGSGFTNRIHKSNYKLTKIISKNGLDRYTINYKTFEWANSIPNGGDGEMVIHRYTGNGPISHYPEPSFNLNNSSYKMIEKLPIAIYHNGIKVIEFEYGNRDDISFVGGQGNKLIAIKILKYRSDEVQKKINFTYNYFGNGTDNLNKRLKLDGIFLSGFDTTNNETNERFLEFEYDRPNQVPAINSYARDFLGYYNGKNENQNLIPHYPLTYIPTYLHMDNFDFNPPNSSRAFNIDYATVGILKKIINSAKGQTILEYGQNKNIVPSNEIYADTANEFVDGFRIESITMKDDDGNFVGKKQYEYLKSRFLEKILNGYHTTTPTIDFIDVHLLSRGYSNPNEVIHYKHVREKVLDSNGNSNGYIEYLFDKDAPTGIMGIIPYSTSEIAPIYNIGYPDGSTVMQKYQYERFDILTQKNVYTKNNELVSQENHDYQEDIDYEGYNFLGLMILDDDLGWIPYADNNAHPEFTRKYKTFNHYDYNDTEAATWGGFDVIYDEFSRITSKSDLSTGDTSIYTYISYPFIDEIDSANYGKTKLLYGDSNYPHLVTEIKKAKPGETLETEVIYKYDTEGNKIQVTKPGTSPENSSYVSYIYGYDNRFVVAELVGVKHEEIDSNLIAQIKTATENPFSNTQDNNIRALLKTLKDNHPNGLVTTYTYNPTLGMMSVTDPKGYTLFNEYDPLGRLQYTKELDPRNGQKYILSENNYHQKPN